MDDDLFTYEVEIPRLASIPCDSKEEDDLDNDDLDIYEPRQWLDLMYKDNKKVDVKVKEEVVSKWLVRSYKKRFEEYMEIKKQWVTHGSDTDMEYDPSNVEFAEWVASKFYNHMTMDQYTKNALWIYWTGGDDEVELTGEESSDPDDEYLIDENEVTEIFRIETNIFDFETPTCKAFKEFNYLFQIDPDVLTKDIIGFKTYKEYKEDYIYEWNEDVPWVHEKPWTDNEVWEEPALVKHYCEPFSFKSRHFEWPTCSWKDDGYCNGGNLPGAYRIGNTLRYQ
ncbi:hypothetical protein Tco_0908602 [Tanacetum coccineum]|uniref:VIER F-box protein 2 n=1 Tax=Tanacetum coccineum TaxID=301880 RepID=A0ABQ5CPR5_9ASTR